MEKELSPRIDLWSDLECGIWNIPVPHEKNPVKPATLLVPLLGFDAVGYRLGHGGGYYDRTLASLAERPLTIGVGYEFGRLETIFPQADDIPMDAMVTEKRRRALQPRYAQLGSVAAAEGPISLNRVETSHDSLPRL